MENFYYFKSQHRLIVLFVILMCAISSLTVCAQSFPYRFNHLTVDEGLSHTDANDIAQDPAGYIWVATFFGLDRYDGYAIKKYYNNNVPLSNAFKNRILCLYPDTAGNIWLGTEDGVQCFDIRTERYIDFTELGNSRKTVFSKLYKLPGNRLCGFSGGMFKMYVIRGTTLVEQELHVPKGTKFSSITMGDNHQLFLTSNSGLWRLIGEENFVSVSIDGLDKTELNRLFFNRQGKLIVSKKNQLFLLKNVLGNQTSQSQDRYTIEKKYVLPENTSIRDIAHGRKDYWINTGSELVRLDRNFNFIQYVDKRSSQSALNSSSLTRIFIDRSECLWICTFGGGVNFCDLNQKLFYTLQHEYGSENSLSGNHIRSILENENELWIGTTANGLNLYDFNTRRFSHFNASTSPIRIKDDAVTALVLDQHRNLWIGTNKGISILNANKSALVMLNGSDKFPKTSIEALVKDCFGNIWFGNHADRYGVIWKDQAGVYHVKYYGEGEGYFIWADRNKPLLFISSNHGLRQLNIDSEGNIVKARTYRASSTHNSLSSDYTYPVSRQNDSTYWIGTMGGGLNQLKFVSERDFRFIPYNLASGLQYDVESLEIDDNGKVWMGGNGLQCLDPVTGKLTRYDKNDGLQGNSFKVGASYRGKDGRLYFGGINGLNYFYPRQIKANDIPARPVLTDLMINNHTKFRTVNALNVSFEKSVGFLKELKLTYLQNNFTISFSAMHFANPLKCRYRYKLIGFDKEWQYTDGRNPRASYSNLEFNNYNFVVQASNNDEIWSKNTAEVAIRVSPPWWKSTWAKWLYALCFLSGISMVYIFQHKWHRMKTEIQVRAINEKKREELHQHQKDLYQQQLTFFTNVSHEFRTPLTLILGPLESLISQNKDSALDHSYQLMFRNAKRLINLIGELMNFRKVADGILRLQIQPIVINDFCKDIAWEFQNMAVRKGINFQLLDHTRGRDPWPMIGVFDVQIVEKILFNLLNNSFKYTNPGGQISFELSLNLDDFKPAFETGFKILNTHQRAARYIYFRVADNGIGISSESITQIFDRYYRISNNHLGSGVGLALVKSLTQLHKGDIYVYSERHRGTEIVIGLPWGEENYSSDENAPTSADLQVQLEAIDKSILLTPQDEGIASSADLQYSRKRILIVEDNQELRSFLRKTLERQYSVEEAEDGISAVGLASKALPDLIISDVMMPGMNGIEFCRIMKERFETRHIPFIILSAKDNLETKLEGMDSGADYYFAKPLSTDLLLLTIRNIFDQGAKLKQKYTNDYLSEATELVHSEKDKAFFQRLLDVIEANIQDEALDVDFLCKKLYVSRTKLYQKIKSTSDQSVGEFIRNIRLKKAIQIMTHEDIAINEVVDRIGFQSSSNFSRAFKKEYGKSPLQFVQSLKKGDTSER